ncbi:MAG TPA: hypothetical protein VK694_00015 [Verrucomicrobiae bacterium]|nr:hypothetical protein [Verrucomicrobiae bacterium]
MNVHPDNHESPADLHWQPEGLTNAASLDAAVDYSLRTVMEGGSPTAAAATMMEIANTAKEQLIVLPGYEDAASSVHTIATMAVRTLRSHINKTDLDSAGYAPSLHLLADAETLARKQAEEKTRWLQLHRVFVSQEDGTEAAVEFLGTPSESALVPFTSDGKIILVQRQSPASGEDIITVLTRAAIDDLDPELVALQALHKLDIPGSQEALPVPTGTTKHWKYLDSETNHFAVDLPMTTDELLSRASTEDSKTKAIVALSEQEFFEAVNAGTIDNFGTINAVQLALAKRHGLFESQDEGFEGDPRILEILNEDLGIVRTEIVETETISWFPQTKIQGETIVQSHSGQAQALGVIHQDGVPQSFVMLIEPFLAQGKRSLALASGSIKDDDGAYTAVSEMKEETGYDSTSSRQLVPPTFLMPLYMQGQSEVWEVSITVAGEKVGGDEKDFEQGEGVVIPIDRVGWYIKNGYITDASTIAAIFAYMRAADLRHIEYTN